MAVKKSYTIKDMILNDKYEVSGQNGVLDLRENGLMLLDFNQMGQHIIENVCINEHEISKKDIKNVCFHWSQEIRKIILDEVYEICISNVEDDEELNFTENILQEAKKIDDGKYALLGMRHQCASYFDIDIDSEQVQEILEKFFEYGKQYFDFFNWLRSPRVHSYIENNKWP